MDARAHAAAVGFVWSSQARLTRSTPGGCGRCRVRSVTPSARLNRRTPSNCWPGAGMRADLDLASRAVWSSRTRSRAPRARARWHQPTRPSRGARCVAARCARQPLYVGREGRNRVCVWVYRYRFLHAPLALGCQLLSHASEARDHSERPRRAARGRADSLRCTPLPRCMGARLRSRSNRAKPLTNQRQGRPAGR